MSEGVGKYSATKAKTESGKIDIVYTGGGGNEKKKTEITLRMGMSAKERRKGGEKKQGVKKNQSAHTLYTRNGQRGGRRPSPGRPVPVQS